MKASDIIDRIEGYLKTPIEFGNFEGVYAFKGLLPDETEVAEIGKDLRPLVKLRLSEPRGIHRGNRSYIDEHAGMSASSFEITESDYREIENLVSVVQAPGGIFSFAGGACPAAHLNPRPSPYQGLVGDISPDTLCREVYSRRNPTD